MKGFFNAGNTCYFNSAVQNLMQVLPLSQLFLIQEYTGKCCFTREYQSVVRQYWSSEENVSLDLSKLLGCLKTHFLQFGDGGQHDVQETIMCILDILEKSIPKLKEIFYGKLRQETVYPGGNSCVDSEFCFSLLEPGETLEECLTRTHDWKTIDDYQDNDGKVWKVSATRTSYISIPKYLMFSFLLKRNMSIPINLKINESNFVLASTSIHYGIQEGGHYVALINKDGEWKLIDDDSIVDVEFPEKAQHYTIMYRCLNPETL